MQSLLTQVAQIFDQENFIHEPHELYDPIDYTLRLGGKRIRPLLLLTANQMFDGDICQVRYAAIGIETFHNFTLLHDDLMDHSPIRRGQPTVYRRWNENTAILSGDTMFALAWQYFLRQPHPNLHQILKCFNQTAIEVCEGQQYDMNFEQRDDITIPDYMNMIRLKTAVLLAASLKIGALYANAPLDDIDNLYQFGIHLGLAFQLQDDLLDAYGDVAVFGKQTGQDIRDNKKTFLYLKALQLATPAQQAQLRALFAPTSTLDPDTKVHDVLQIYQQLGIQRHVQDSIQNEFDLATQALQIVRVDDAKKQTLQHLSDTLLQRKK